MSNAKLKFEPEQSLTHGTARSYAKLLALGRLVIPHDIFQGLGHANDQTKTHRIEKGRFLNEQTHRHINTLGDQIYQQTAGKEST